MVHSVIQKCLVVSESETTSPIELSGTAKNYIFEWTMKVDVVSEFGGVDRYGPQDSTLK